ncbi:hypothetical protein Fmac_025478 [Flemingia macrophylla]|uniref:AP2/ERF domain-containing protein n=1 Tax=Flemingia macrophylla TaxID=520843 RepID=A0ABD1LU47_9FABA
MWGSSGMSDLLESFPESVRVRTKQAEKSCGDYSALSAIESGDTPQGWLDFSSKEPHHRATAAQEKRIVPRQPQIKKSHRGPRDCGKQVYLGGFDTAHATTRAYDQAAIKFHGVDVNINFKLF